MRSRVRKQFALALAMSLAAHALALRSVRLETPAPGRSFSPITLAMAIAPPEASPEPEPELAAPDELRLGVDAPLPPSETWLGFADFQPHFAPPAAVEQAAMAERSLAASAAPAEAMPRSDSPMGRSSAEPASVSTPVPMPTPDVISDPAPRAPTDDRDQDEAVTAIADSFDDGAMFDPMQQLIAQAQRQSKAFLETPQSAHALADIAHATKRSVPEPAQTQPAEELNEMRVPATGRSSAAMASDRESEASSILDVPREHWQLGKPLAAQGLEVKPRRPEMTVLTALTAWPRNPLCRISFDRAGVPKRATIVESTGDSRVDAAIEASLYRWRAAGKELQPLQAGETLDLTIRLLINPSRRG